MNNFVRAVCVPGGEKFGGTIALYILERARLPSRSSLSSPAGLFSLSLSVLSLIGEIMIASWVKGDRAFEIVFRAFDGGRG